MAARLEIINSIEGFTAAQAQWSALEHKVEDLLPFQTYAWNRTWWEVFAEDHSKRQDRLAISVLRSDEEWLGVLPQFLSVYRRLGLDLFCYRRPFGADPNLTELRLPLALPDHLSTLMQAELVRQKVDGAPCNISLLVAPEGVLTASSVEPGAGLLRHDLRNVPAYELDLAKDWETFRGGLKRNIKESLRHCYNSLKRAGLSHELVVLSQPQEILSLLPQFYRFHEDRAQQSDTIKHPNYFAAEQHRTFIETLAAGKHGDVGMRMLCLKIDGKVVAMRLAYELNKRLYLYFSGFDSEYGQFGVPTTLVAETIRWAIDRQLQTVHLSIGTDVSKTRWGPRKVDYLETLMFQNVVYFNIWKLGSRMRTRID